MPSSALKTHKFKWDFWKTVTLVILLLFAVFLVYPLFMLFLSGFKDSETQLWTMGNFAKFFGKRYYYGALKNSFLLTICVTALTILIGTPLAYFMTTCKIKGKGIIEILIIVSMMSPAFIGA